MSPLQFFFASTFANVPQMQTALAKYTNFGQIFKTFLATFLDHKSKPYTSASIHMEVNY